MSADITYFEVEAPDEPVEAQLDLWVGIETRGKPYVWVGEETSGACKRIGLEDLIDTLVTATDDLIDTAKQAADDIIDGLDDLGSDIEIPDLVYTLAQVIFAIVLLILVAAAFAGSSTVTVPAVFAVAIVGAVVAA